MSGEGSLFDVPPAAIGRFRVLHQVGAGTSGPVFRGVHPDTNSPLAIKLVRLALTPERVPSVAAALAALADDLPTGGAICPVVDAGVHGGSPYLVTPFAPGDSLDVALKQFGPAALVDLVPRLRLLARALDTAAERGIVHGALHPRDVLVSESVTWITGLGVWPVLARHGERLPVRRPYRAPDLADNAVSAAGDRFALAALAYEWMTGRRAPSAFVAGDMAPLPGVDRAAIGSVFARALHADPDQRDASCLEFVAALEAVAGTGEAGATSTAVPPEPRARRRAPRASPVPSLPLDALPAELADEGSTADARESRAARGEDDHPASAGAVVDESARHVAEGLDSPGEIAGEEGPPSGLDEPSGVRLAEAPGSSLFGAAHESPASESSGVRWGTLGAGAAIGLVVGLAVGYVLWGRLAPADPRDATLPSTPAGRAAEPPPAARDAEPPAAAASAPPAPPPQPAESGDTSAVAPAPAPPREAAGGNLLVRSTPAGATVFVDGTRRGVTPLTLQRVPLGTRRVRIQQDGFDSEERQIALTESRPSRSLDVRLTRAAAPARLAAAATAPGTRTGTLVIESRPTGAAVLLNGRRVGVTPMTLDDLEPGSYTVELQLPAHRSVTTTVRVNAGARARAAASLERAQEQP